MENTYYIRRKKIGEGTYAVIYLADAFLSNESYTNKIIQNPPFKYKSVKKVAIKKIKKIKESEGVELNGIREILLLKNIRNEFILRMEDIFIYDDNINIVLEYVEQTLENIIKDKTRVLMPDDIREYVRMMSVGLHALHKQFFLHRDLKPSNILITGDNRVKIADFGMTRHISHMPMSVNIITRWYRAPEILMGGKTYSYNVDIWSLGCIFGELFLRIPLFTGETDLEQLDLIFKLLGSPPKILSELSGFLNFDKYEGEDLSKIFRGAPIDAIELLREMLQLNPDERITTVGILNNKYFK